MMCSQYSLKQQEQKAKLNKKMTLFNRRIKLQLCFPLFSQLFKEYAVTQKYSNVVDGNVTL